MRRAAFLTLLALAAVLPARTVPAQTSSPETGTPMAEAPTVEVLTVEALTAERVRRFTALCEETRTARADQARSMQTPQRIDLDDLARKHGFEGQEEVMEIAMRIAMTEMYAADPETAKQMLDGPMDPDMKAMLARAATDLPAVTANAEALKACKAG